LDQFCQNLINTLWFISISFSVAISTSEELHSSTNGSGVYTSVCLTSLIPYMFNSWQKYMLLQTEILKEQLDTMSTWFILSGDLMVALCYVFSCYYNSFKTIKKAVEIWYDERLWCLQIPFCLDMCNFSSPSALKFGNCFRST